jgi:glycosyltransferase involved in cell wall biosynthesis
MLAEAMNKYIEAPELIEKHGQLAQQFIQQNFSETKMINQYITLYHQSLGL